jgi:tetratricopeptide (TPR) repeat protein
MALFKRKPPTRAELLGQAARALGKGRRRKALALYLQALELTPDDLELHGRIAPLLAAAGRREEAWESYCRAAEHHREEGFVERAISVYRQAAEKLPRTVEVWERIAELQVERNHPGEARRTLLEGCGHFRWGRWRQRLRLTRRLHALDPASVDATCRLARLLVRDGQKREALDLLAGLEPSLGKPELKRVRAQAVRLSPTPASGWRWLRAVVAGR